MKTCQKCGKQQSIQDFFKDSRYLDNLSQNCKTCDKRKRKIENINGRSARKSHLKRKYNLSPKQYQELFDKQCGYCYICFQHQDNLKKKLAVDHDHKTNEIRGLLCIKCNTILGQVKDSTEILQRMINYLNKKEKYGKVC